MKANSVHRFRVSPTAALLLSLTVLPQLASSQVLFDWVNTAPDGNWKQGASGGRWFNNSTTDTYFDEPDTNSILRINNNHETTMVNNVDAGYVIHELQFGSSATSNRTITGNSVTFQSNSGGPKLENFSSGTHSIAFDISIGTADGLEINPVNGDLTLSGSIDTNGHSIKIYGNNGNTLNISGSISEGGGITIFQNSTLNLSGSNSFTGATSITAGTLQLSGSGDLGNTSGVTISSGASLDLNDVDLSVPSVRETGSSNGGTVDLGTGTLTLTGADSGTLFQNSISGSGGITMAGSGSTSLSLYGSQSYTGTTTVSGAKISTGVSMGTSAVVVSGGEFEATADDVLSDSATLSVSAGTLDLQGSDTVGSMEATGGSVTLGSGKTITLGGDSSIGSTASITGGTLSQASGNLAFNTASGGTTDVTIQSGATLSGTGTIGGDASISGTHAAGASVGKQTITGDATYNASSAFEWELNYLASDEGAREVNYDGVDVGGSLGGNDAVFEIVLPGSSDFSDAFWNSTLAWTDIFTSDGNTPISDWAGIFTSLAYFNLDGGSKTGIAAPSPSQGAFSLSGNTLTWTAIPEPSSALAGLLLGSALLRRKRR